MLEATNEEEAIVYVGLKIMFDKMLTQNRDQVEVNFNIINLFYELSGSFQPTRTDREKIEKGIQGLIDADIVNLIDRDTKGNYVLNILGLKIRENESYTTMTRDEIRNIFKIPCKQKFNLLRFAIGIFGTINTKNSCGFASYKKMSELTGVTRVASCQSYFQLLEDNNIIYVRHPNQAKRDSDGRIKYLSNCYGRPCDKEQIDKFYVDRCKEQAHDFTNRMGSSRKAQLTRNYNKYLNNAYKGDVIELIKECLVFNKIPYNEQNPEWQKDMSVFDPKLIKVAEEGLQEHIKQGKKIEKKKEKEKYKNQWAMILNPEIVKEINARAKAWQEQQDIRFLDSYDSDEAYNNCDNWHSSDEYNDYGGRNLEDFDT